MGSDDLAVTDGQGHVRDVERLRIVDGSILPRVPSANINAPIIMVAEKISAKICPLHPALPPGREHCPQDG